MASLVVVGARFLWSSMRGMDASNLMSACPNFFSRPSFLMYARVLYSALLDPRVETNRVANRRGNVSHVPISPGHGARGLTQQHVLLSCRQHARRRRKAKKRHLRTLR